MRLSLTPNQSIGLVTLFSLLVYNVGFWRNVAQQTLQHHAGNQLYLWLTLPLLVAAVLYLVLQLLFWPRVHRIVVPLLLVLSAAASWAVMTQNIYFNADQIQNILQTDPNEARAWINPRFIGWALLTGVLPAWLYLKYVRIRPATSQWRAAAWRVAGMLVPILVVLGIAAMGYQNYASFFRNNKDVKNQMLPMALVYAGIKTGYNAYDASRPFEPIGLDAQRVTSTAASPRKQVLVVVEGETTRAASWGLNPGAPATTPRLAAMPDVINYPDTTACGTSTAVSVPCMFAPETHADFNGNRAKHQENLMDVLKRAGVATAWLENDSGCKGICDRIPHRDIYLEAPKEQCHGNLCFDSTMLEPLKQTLTTLTGDAVIVLHANGSHGPAYFERYPDQYRKFTPTCDTNQMQDCSREQLLNTYQNTVVAQDAMLADTIQLLQQTPGISPALLYLSDHGESLGENGMFLHAAPYAVAPDVQTHVPMVFWGSKDFYADRGLDAACLKTQAGKPHSHDNLFHSVLGAMNVKTALYQRDLDLFAGCKVG